MDQAWLSSFRLSGGTSLSLLLGHRISYDLDLFTDSKFNLQELIQQTQIAFPNSELIRLQNQKSFAGNYGASFLLEGIKTDFYYWNTKFFTQPVTEESLRLTDMRELAAMKLEAVLTRTEKKDFYDLAAIFDYYSLTECLRFFSQRYPFINRRLPFDALTKIDTAAESEPIICLKNCVWKEVVDKIKLAQDEHLKFLRDNRR